MELSRYSPTWRFYLLWVLANAVAATSTLVVADLLVFYQFVLGRSTELAFDNDNAVGPVVSFALLVILLLGLFVGFAQALVLRYSVNFGSWKLWWLASSVLVPSFFLLAAFILIYVNSLLPTFPIRGDNFILYGLAASPGLAFGLGQWLLSLLRHVRSSGWWVAANTFAWPLGVAGGLLVMRSVGASYFATPSYQFPFYPLQSALYWSVGCFTGAVIFSALTGIVLVRLLRR